MCKKRAKIDRKLPKPAKHALKTTTTTTGKNLDGRCLQLFASLAVGEGTPGTTTLQGHQGAPEGAVHGDLNSFNRHLKSQYSCNGTN